MISMTGYGRGTARLKNLEIVVELSGVNRKNLDIVVSGPRDWNALESVILDRLRKDCQRGRVHVAIRTQETEGFAGLQWDDAAVEQAISRLKESARKAGVTFEADAHLFLDVIQLLRQGHQLPDTEQVGPVLMEALEEALKGFLSMREEEGRAMAADLSKRLETLQSFSKTIARDAPDMVTAYRERLFSRLRQAGLELDLDDERVLKEIGLFADRCDISEELTRLDSHFSQVAEAFEVEGGVGRKLEFIVQEINREFNTIGSKAQHIEISRTVIEAKNELDRFREQVANVE